MKSQTIIRVACSAIILGCAGISLGVSLAPKPSQSQTSPWATATLQNTSGVASFATISTLSGSSISSHGLFLSGSGQVSNSIGGTYTIGSNGRVYWSEDRPTNSRWHAVTDTYYDENGNVVGKQTVAHVVDPQYCQPGRRDEPRVATMPASIRKLIADAAAVEQYPTETVLPEINLVKYAEVK